VVAIVLGAFILMGIGAAMGKTKTVTKVDTSGANTARLQLAATEGKLAAAQGNVNALQQQITSQQATIKQLQDNAGAVAAQKAQLDQLQAKNTQQADQQKAQLQQQLDGVTAQKQQLDQRQAAANASTFSDGLYQVGKDIQAGQYHSDGGSTCYWAKLRSSDTSDIANNNMSSGPQTITINSAYFTSNGCGTWTKVG
jgi:TolA-binding protein